MVLAEEIHGADPDVVALQEVSLYRLQTPGDWQSGDAPQFHHGRIGFSSGAARRAGCPGDAVRRRCDRHQRRRRAPSPDARRHDIRYPPDQSGRSVGQGRVDVRRRTNRHFSRRCQPTHRWRGSTTPSIRPRITSVDVTKGGNTVRVVDSHLEVGGLLGRIQEQQARELLEALEPYGGPLILAGDFDGPGDGSGTASYALLTNRKASPSALRDVWEFRHGPTGTFPRPIIGRGRGAGAGADSRRATAPAAWTFRRPLCWPSRAST